MSKLPIDVEDLARKVAEAFAAAFPKQSHMVTSPAKSRLPKTQPIAALMPPASCPHKNTKTPVRRLPVPRHCPTCVIFGPIEEIQDVQCQLVNRGGAFLSKEKDEYHKVLKQQWRRAKVGLMTNILLFERLLDDAQVPEDDKAKIQLALEAYEKRKAALARVPGLEYVEDAEEDGPTEEHQEVARLIMDLPKKVLDKEMEAEDKKYSAQRASMTTVEAPAKPWRQRTAEQRLTMTMRQPQPPPMVAPVSQPVPIPPTPRKSILKRRNSLSSVSSVQSKRIRITDTVIVSPAHLNVSDASVLIPVRAEPTIQSHSEHSSAEHKRARGHFWRPGSNYTPGIWASQAHEEKTNTSNLKAHWDELIKQEDKEAAKEKEVSEKLKSIVKTWVALWITTKAVDYIGPEE